MGSSSIKIIQQVKASVQHKYDVAQDIYFLLCQLQSNSQQYLSNFALSTN